MKKSMLTDSEWMALIDKERDELPPCCANIADLRDEIIAIAREGGSLPPWNGMALLRTYRVALDGHGRLRPEEFPVLTKLVQEVAQSMGYTLEQVRAFPHEGKEKEDAGQ
jgi:hypothetical protein